LFARALSSCSRYLAQLPRQRQMVSGERNLWAKCLLGNGPYPDYKTSLLGYWNIWEVDRGSPSALHVDGLKARTGKQTADAAYLAETMRYVASHPGPAIIGIGTKLWRHLSSYEIPRTCNFSTLREHVLVWRIPYIPYSLMLGLALLGLRGSDRRVTWLFLLPWIASLTTEVSFSMPAATELWDWPFLIPSACARRTCHRQLRSAAARALVAGSMAMLVALFALGHLRSEIRAQPA